MRRGFIELACTDDDDDDEEEDDVDDVNGDDDDDDEHDPASMLYHSFNVVCQRNP